MHAKQKVAYVTEYFSIYLRKWQLSEIENTIKGSTLAVS
jgi:hypothetical protein